MPPGRRIRENNVFGIVNDNPLLASSTTYNSNQLVLVPVVAGDHAVITLDPLRQFGEPEIVVVTAHTAAATVATITRGAYGTTARTHPQGTIWVHAPIDQDVVEILTSSTRPTDPYNGQIIHETDTGRWTSRLNGTWIPAPHNVPACRVFHNANQSATDNTLLTSAFNSERYDTDSMHDTVTNNSRITFNTAGVYSIMFNGRFSAANDYSLAGAFIRLNGATFIAINTGGRALVGTADLLFGVSTMYKFAVGDYVELQVLQKNTTLAARNLEVVTNYSPEFSATWISVG